MGGWTNNLVNVDQLGFLLDLAINKMELAGMNKYDPKYVAAHSTGGKTYSHLNTNQTECNL